MLEDKRSKTEISNDGLKSTLGLAVSVIATEHFMSAGLSSPWSVAKFAISDQDKQEVWHYFNEAAIASLIFGSIISWKLHSIWPGISSAGTVLYYRKLYKNALSRTPTQNPTPVLSEWIPLTEEQKKQIDNILKNNEINSVRQNNSSNNDDKFGYIYSDYS